jgi:hypothetical protein
MKEKIHCDLLDLFGPDWANLDKSKINLITDRIHTFSQLLGEEPNLYGFVGTRKINNNIVGGYFAIQYSEEEFHYDKHKHLLKIQNTPFERILFVLFSGKGKVLLQNSKFTGIELTMPIALNLFKDALNHILKKNKMYPITNIDLAPEEVTKEEFINIFTQSNRVYKICVMNPEGRNIPEEFVYYNPQKERNSIIKESHSHDYPNIKKIDLEATDSGDLKQIHLRDVIFAGNPHTMSYSTDEGNFTLRRSIKRKFEFYVDMDSEQISEEELFTILEMLKTERTVDIDTPTPKKANQSSQLDLFGKEENDEEE